MRWVFVAAVTVLLSSHVALAGYYFADEFTTFRSDTWQLYRNGYPDPAIRVSGGFLCMGRPGPLSLDFPVIYSKGAILPPVGDYALEIGFRYTFRYWKGVGFRALTPGPPYYTVFQFWQGFHPLVVRWGDRRRGFPSTTRYRVLRFEIIGNMTRAYLDGTYLGTASLPYGRPALLYFGHPRPGQVFGIPGFVRPYVDANGILRRRWWGYGRWSNLAIDYVRVQMIPEPTSWWLLLGGAGCLCAIRRRRKHAAEEDIGKAGAG